MKTKKFAKKLTLNKNTIANLSNGQLVKIKGGVADTEHLCVPSFTLTNCDECPSYTCETCSTCVTCNACSYTCNCVITHMETQCSGACC